MVIGEAMTLPGAHDTARSGAERFGNIWNVYRLPAWPGGVYSCKAGELPPDAVIIETYPKPDAAPSSPEPGAPAQGSLF